MDNVQFPAQQLSMSKKTRNWRKQCVDFADSKLHFNYTLVRNSILHLKINYDLIGGKLHMDDVAAIINPEDLKGGFIPTSILHYPIINSKLNVLRGEEAKRVFDYKVIVTNPNAISEIEEKKKELIIGHLLSLIKDSDLSEELYLTLLLKANEYYLYDYLDFREINGNCILNHYVKEQDMSLLFNLGIMDAMVIGEEIYQCDIVGGEPVIERLNPMKVRVFKSGYSNKIEDADMIVLEDYWSPGRVIDTYYDVLSKEDMKYLETLPDHLSLGAIDSMDNIDDRYGFVNYHMVSDEIADSAIFFDPAGEYSASMGNSLLPFDLNGNIRVLRVYWKSRRKIKKIKFYDENGDEDFTFMPEDYICNKFKGEEEESFWINEAWEGTKIGENIYVNMHPRLVLYNRLANPSRCHFGIVGSIYNLNDDKPFSLVDMMKPYNYLYDVIHDRLNKMMSRNWGKMTRLDFAKKPKSWDIEKWLYYAKTMGLYVEDSFNEGMRGAALNKLAGGLNTNSLGVIDADFGNNIQLYINLLEYIKLEMADVAGISKQREGLVSNRETVGGVERATLLSSHITEWVFTIHEDVKKRALEVFLETAKVALRGRNKKFWNILPDASKALIEVDGDDFAECDYGLVVDNSNGTQELQSKIETLALAALLNQTLSFSTIMRLYTSASLAEKQRLVEIDERLLREQLQQMQQLQQQSQLQMAQMELQTKQQEMQLKDQLNLRDNETKIKVAEINSQAEMAILELKNNVTDADLENQDTEEYSQEAKDKLMQDMVKFDKQMAFNREKLAFDKLKHSEDNALKERLSRQKSSTNK